jgi:hypothetical protein
MTTQKENYCSEKVTYRGDESGANLEDPLTTFVCSTVQSDIGGESG